MFASKGFLKKQRLNHSQVTSYTGDLILYIHTYIHTYIYIYIYIYASTYFNILKDAPQHLKIFQNQSEIFHLSIVYFHYSSIVFHIVTSIEQRVLQLMFSSHYICKCSAGDIELLQYQIHILLIIYPFPMHIRQCYGMLHLYACIHSYL